MRLLKREGKDKKVVHPVSSQPCRGEEISFKIYGIHSQRAHPHVLKKLYTGPDESSVGISGEISREGEMTWFLKKVRILGLSHHLGCHHDYFADRVVGRDHHHSPIYYSTIPLLVNEIKNSVAHVFLDNIKYKSFKMFNLKRYKTLPEAS